VFDKEELDSISVFLSLLSSITITMAVEHTEKEIGRQRETSKERDEDTRREGGERGERPNYRETQRHRFSNLIPTPPARKTNLASRLGVPYPSSGALSYLYCFPCAASCSWPSSVMKVPQPPVLGRSVLPKRKWS